MLEFALFWVWMTQPQVVVTPGPETGEPVRITQAESAQLVSQSPQPPEAVPPESAQIRVHMVMQGPDQVCAVPLLNVLPRGDVRARIRTVPPPGSKDQMPVIVPVPSCRDGQQGLLTRSPESGPGRFLFRRRR